MNAVLLGGGRTEFNGNTLFVKFGLIMEPRCNTTNFHQFYRGLKMWVTIHRHGVRLFYGQAEDQFKNVLMITSTSYLSLLHTLWYIIEKPVGTTNHQNCETAKWRSYLIKTPLHDLYINSNS